MAEKLDPEDVPEDAAVLQCGTVIGPDGEQIGRLYSEDVRG